MNYAHLDDGRLVIVDSARNQKRKITTQLGTGEYHIDKAYVNALLDGHWQTVKRSRLKAAHFGSPFGGIKVEK
jgi:hypothetical protein